MPVQQQRHGHDLDQVIGIKQAVPGNPRLERNIEHHDQRGVSDDRVDFASGHWEFGP